MPPIETDRERIAALAEQQRDETAAFRYYVEAIWFGEKRSSAELDALVDRIAAGVIHCRLHGVRQLLPRDAGGPGPR